MNMLTLGIVLLVTGEARVLTAHGNATQAEGEAALATAIAMQPGGSPAVERQFFVHIPEELFVTIEHMFHATLNPELYKEVMNAQ